MKLLTVAAMLALAGCAAKPLTGPTAPASAPISSNSDISQFKTEVDGFVVTCIVFKGWKESSLSCDWVNKKPVS